MKAERPEKLAAGPGRHSVQVVSRETGLTPDTLRVWERRYAVVVPSRSEGRQRLYSDDEVERLKVLALLVRGGRRIKDVAVLRPDEIQELMRRDASAQPPAMSPPESPVEECMQAIEALDGDALNGVLHRVASAVGAATFVESVIPDVLREIGRRWEHGTLSIAHEHVATVHVRSQLVHLLAQQQPRSGAPLLVATTPSGESHELGALSAAVIAAAAGWRAVFLGASVPSDDVAVAARQLGAVAIALSIVHPAVSADVEGELQRLAASLGRGVTLLVGGPGATTRRADIERAGGRVLEDYGGLRRELGLLPARARS